MQHIKSIVLLTSFTRSRQKGTCIVDCFLILQCHDLEFARSASIASCVNFNSIVLHMNKYACSIKIIKLTILKPQVILIFDVIRKNRLKIRTWWPFIKLNLAIHLKAIEILLTCVIRVTDKKKHVSHKINNKINAL